MRRAVSFGLALLSFLAVPASVRATALVRMEVEDLARAAEVVAVARVQSVEARWEPDRAAIRTHVTLALESAIAGEAPRSLHVSVLGGTVDGVTAVYAAGAAFTPGERVVVFLERRRTRAGEWLVTGAFQGAFRLEREPETGMDVAVRENTRAGVALTGEATLDAPARMYVVELAARVRAARGGAR